MEFQPCNYPSTQCFISKFTNQYPSDNLPPDCNSQSYGPICNIDASDCNLNRRAFSLDPEFQATQGFFPNDIPYLTDLEVDDVEPDFCLDTQPDPDWTSRKLLQRMYVIIARPEWDHLMDRALFLWDIYIRKSPTGLHIRDSDLMVNIALQLATKFRNLKYSCEFMEMLVTHLKKGVRLLNSGDGVESRRLAYSLDILGYAISGSCSHAQEKLLSVLKNWINRAAKKTLCPKIRKEKLCCKDPRVDLAKTKVIHTELFLSALEQSQLAQILVDYVVDGNYTNAYCDVLHILKGLCDLSGSIRSRLVESPLLEALLIKLCLEDIGNKILSRTIELIYAYLGTPVDTARKIRMTPSPSEKTFELLLARLFKQFTQTSSKLQINLRNDTAFAICLLVRNIPSLRKSFGQYAAPLVSLLCSNVLGLRGIPISLIIDSTPEDAELLKYIIWMVHLIIESNSIQNINYENYLVPVLLKIIVGPSNLMDEIRKLTPTETLESLAWSTLACIARQEPQSFLQKDGVPTMLAYIRSYSENEEINMQTFTMFTHILRTVLSATEENNDTSEIISYFNNLDALNIFIETIMQLTNFTRQTCKNFSSSQEPSLCNLLFCSASMGQSGMAMKVEFCENNGVKLIIRLIRQSLYQYAHERHMTPMFHIAIAECILRCIASSPTCMEPFLAYEGLLRLLDLLELSAGPAAATHILNCLLELCEYSRCMDQLLYWQRPMRNLTKRLAFGDGFDLPVSKLPGAVRPSYGEAVGEISENHDENLPALFCELWRAEEERYGVLRDGDGCITSIERPLMSKYARDYQAKYRKITKKPMDFPIPSTLDLTGSVRPKIYLLVKKVTEAVNTEALLFECLSLKNQVTMQLMINFLDLKSSEVWMDLKDNLLDCRLKLVQTDQHAIRALVRISQNKVAAVIETQRYLIQRALEREEIHERQFYNVLQKCHLQDHLKAVREAEYRTRTTDYTYMVEKRLWQKAQLENAVPKLPSNFRIHRTTDGPLNITVWPWRNKMVESEPPVPENDETREKVLGNVDIKLPDWSESTIAIRPSMISFKPVENETPPPTELGGGTAVEDDQLEIARSVDGTEYYQVAPEVLRKALQGYIDQQKKRSVMNLNDENYWKMRTKWKLNWYP